MYFEISTNIYIYPARIPGSFGTGIGWSMEWSMEWSLCQDLARKFKKYGDIVEVWVSRQPPGRVFWRFLEQHRVAYTQWFMTFIQTVFACEDLLLSPTRPTKMWESKVVQLKTVGAKVGKDPQSQNLWMQRCWHLGPSSHWRYGRRTVPGEAC